MGGDGYQRGLEQFGHNYLFQFDHLLPGHVLHQLSSKPDLLSHHLDEISGLVQEVLQVLESERQRVHYIQIIQDQSK